MKTAIKKYLQKKKLFYPLKYSRLFHLYQRLFKPENIRQERREISFYSSFLPDCDLIFDIGANDGHKTLAFLAIAKKIVCCEPDAENFTILKSRFRENRNRVIIENKAVTDKEGSAKFYIHHAGSAFNTLSEKWMRLLEDDKMSKWDEIIKFTGTKTIVTTTLDLLIAKYGVPDFIKIDVEGFESWVLKGLSHRIACLSFESLLPDYSDELNLCLNRIQQIEPAATFNIAKNEKLLLKQFVNKGEIEDWLSANNNLMSFEVVVKMST